MFELSKDTVSRLYNFQDQVQRQMTSVDEEFAHGELLSGYPHIAAEALAKRATLIMSTVDSVLGSLLESNSVDAFMVSIMKLYTNDLVNFVNLKNLTKLQEDADEIDCLKFEPVRGIDAIASVLTEAGIPLCR